MGAIAITGATGFVGASTRSQMLAAGEDCVTLGRQPTSPDLRHRQMILGSPLATDMWDGVDRLIHCAWDLTAISARDVYQRNVVGSIALLRTAAAAGVRRIIFISSMSAYQGTRQLYGRSKLEVEREVAELGGVSLRLGLVWGHGAGGMAGAVQKLTKLPLVPVLGRHSYQYTTHRDDMDQAIKISLTDDTLSGVIGVAHPDRVTLPRLLTGLAQEGGADAAGRLVVVPWLPIYWSMRLAQAARVPLPMRADSVLGLVRPAPEVPGANTWHHLGLDLMPFPA